MIKLFRGQSIAISEVEKLQRNVNGLISFNSFLSTSRDKDVALAFICAGSSEEYGNGITRLLFEMTITKNFVFDIASRSQYQGEEECLFMIGSIFQIASVQKSEENYWYVQLNYVADDNLNELKAIKQHFLDRIVVDKGPLHLTWGRFLYHIGEYDLAADHYEKWLKKLGDIDDNELLATIQNDLGVIYYQKQNYAKANEHHTLAFSHALASPFRLDLTVFYDNQGGNQTKLNDYNKALKMYQLARKIEGQRKPINFLYIARLYSNMGSIYYHQHQIPEALNCFEKAFKLQRRIPLMNSIELAVTCNNLGNVYTKTRYYDKACKYHLEAYKIALRSLPPDHPTVQFCLENLNTSKKRLLKTNIVSNVMPYSRERKNSDISICQIEIQSGSTTQT
ncbi:unnamed protein product [Rotaria sp. Silwood2]|nr:unnamed protein product [Rotaria sp. Silwood2]CAF3132145.1 unnamed protein product [Rotaria sp. Silwood2]CAF4439474.1 unnamed protein product [Rotaria sp. Silwood2]CAF4468129.1 unnamed protein product [Rotaria sp. Silwood2]